MHNKDGAFLIRKNKRSYAYAPDPPSNDTKTRDIQIPLKISTSEKWTGFIPNFKDYF